jgi:drug/metabolite transporter (DMT)-like permease
MSAVHYVRARAGLFRVGGGALLWGTTGVAVSIIHDRSGLAAIPIGCYRLIIAALALAVFLRRSGAHRARQLFALHRWRLVVSGAGLGVYQALYFIGVQDVGVSVSTLVSLAVAPVAITAATALGRRRWPSALSLGTLAAAVTGLVFISAAPGTSVAAPHPLIGVLASLGSGLGYAGTTILNARITAGGDPLLLTAVTSSIGALVLLPLALPFGMALSSDLISNWWLLYIGLVPTVLAYWLFYGGLRTTSSEAAGVISLLEPLTAAVLAAVFLHEALSGLGRVGAVLLLAAIVALYVRPPQPELAAPL